MKRMLFIYNPMAGKGAIRNNISYILEEFSYSGYEVVVHPTAGRGDASVTMQEVGDEFDLIVCSGGDGTLDEVVAGMQAGRFRRPIGYIPAGSTNDYAQSLGLPKQMRSAAQSIMKGSVFDCDLGRLEDGYFVYVAAFGAFVNVSYDTPQDMKNALGHMAYIIRGAQSLSTIKSYSMRFESEELSGEGKFMFGMVTNSNSVGGFKGITGKDVTLNDGVFEVTLIREPQVPAVEWPVMLTAVMNKTANKNIVSFKTARLEMWFDESVSWTKDGEYGGDHTHVTIENLPKALPIIIPAEDEASAVTDETEPVG